MLREIVLPYTIYKDSSMNKELLRALVFQQCALEIILTEGKTPKAKKLLLEAKYNLQEVTNTINIFDENELTNNVEWFGSDLGKEVTEMLEDYKAY